MKQLFFWVLALATSGAALAAGNGKTIKVKADKSSVKWEAKKVTGAHNGAINVSSGFVMLTGNKLTGGEVSIDMKSIVCEDIKDEGYNKKFVGHLHSDDFFSTANHPNAILKITKVTYNPNAKAGEANAMVTGSLTIKGTSKPVTFPASISVNGDQLTASGKITIDRTEYDVRYGSGKFFDNLGDKMIEDNFVINFNLIAAN
jgi:polyisoprenoid-binding protein YceI